MCDEINQEEFRELKNYLSSYIIPRDRGGVFSEISRISENIYISDIYRAVDLKKLKKAGIKRILYIGERNKPAETLKAYKTMGITHRRYNLLDSTETDLSAIFDECYQFICGRQKVLIHCIQGVSRSATIVIYFFLRRFYLNLQKNDHNGKNRLFDIIKFVQKGRPCIDPNPNFLQQLMKAEAKFQFSNIV